MKLYKLAVLCVLCVYAYLGIASGASRGLSHESSDGWYSEGDFEPMKRIKLTVSNPLKMDRTECPVIIKRQQLPIQNIPQRYYNNLLKIIAHEPEEK